MLVSKNGERSRAVYVCKPTFGATKIMGRAIVLLALLTLGGCLADRDKDLMACRIDANRFFRSYIADDPDNVKSQFIIGCMTAKGYDFTVTPADCDNRYPFPTQATCYVPNNWLDWMVDELRRKLRPAGGGSHE